jgi:hypothetical protein
MYSSDGGTTRRVVIDSDDNEEDLQHRKRMCLSHDAAVELRGQEHLKHSLPRQLLPIRFVGGQPTLRDSR